MLHDGHQLDVSKAHVDDVIGQLMGDFAVVERTVAVRGDPAPGAQMDLVDGPGGIQGIDAGAVALPFNVVPLVSVVPDHRPRAWRLLTQHGIRIALLDRIARVARTDEVFVDGALADLGDEQLPDTGLIGPRGHRMAVMAPAVEIADHVHAFRIRCPHGKARTLNPVHGVQMRAQLVVGAETRAFAEMVNIRAGQFAHEVASSIDSSSILVIVHSWVWLVPSLQNRLLSWESLNLCSADDR